MLRFTFEDGTTMHITDSMSVMTNKGPAQADQVSVGDYIRCGAMMFCRVDNIAVL